MVRSAPLGAATTAGTETVLRAALDHADQIGANTRPVLRHLLRNEDHSLLNDEVVARVRGLLNNLAQQLAFAMAEAAGAVPHSPGYFAEDEFAAAFIESPAVLGHAHALALEWQLAERMETRLSVDPVLPPLLQSRMASDDPVIASTASAMLAAQARFGQNMRRMELPVTDLPGDLFHHALMTMRALAEERPGGALHAARAEDTLRARYEERRTRLGLIERVIIALREDAGAALSLEQAGVAMFLTALAIGSEQSRDSTILATADSQTPRLALALIASGLPLEAVSTQLLAIHPEASLPDGMAALRPDRAANLLATASGEADR